MTVQHVSMMKKMYCSTHGSQQGSCLFTRHFDPKGSSLTTDDRRFPSVHLRYTDRNILHFNEFSAVIQFNVHNIIHIFSNIYIYIYYI